MAQIPRDLTPDRDPWHFFGAELRHWRDLRGLSQARLGRETHVSGDEIAKVEKAVRWPPPGLAEQCDRVLGTGGVLSRLWPLVERQRLEVRNADTTAREEKGAASRSRRASVELPGQPGDEHYEDAVTNRRDATKSIAALMATGPPPVVELIARLVGLGPARSAGVFPFPGAGGASWAAPVRDAVIDPVSAARRASGGADRHERLAPPALDRAIGTATEASLSADHGQLAQWLPGLIGRVEAASLDTPDPAAAFRALSDVYALAGWTLIKADDPVIAWIAAQRAVRAADHADDVLRVAAATRCLAEVDMRAGRFEDASRTALLAAAHLDTARSCDRATVLCLRGAALLSASAAASRRGDDREANGALNAAAAHGEQLGEDRTDLGTVFGPTNVAIHRVAVAVELADTRTALAHIPTVDLRRMPPQLTERRARFLIDVARAHARVKDDAAALDALVQAESHASAEVRSHRLTHGLLRDLLQRENRSSGLRALAARCGLRN
jgi:transcriptional regulator with XRE-family HTH domain